MSEPDGPARFVDLAAEIVAAYVANNSVRSDELAQLISDVHRAVAATVNGPAEPVPEPLKSAVSVRKSVAPDRLVCLDCGKAYKSLKRHLQSYHELTPAAYRERWSLPSDYPMVAPNYSNARSELAKRAGLGQQRQKPEAPSAPTAPEKKATRGRKPKAAATKTTE